MRGAIPPLTQHAFMAWCSLKKHRDNFTFTTAYLFLRNTMLENNSPYNLMGNLEGVHLEDREGDGRKDFR
jgi:hypothetical protein